MPTLLGVSAITERLRDADTEIKDQRPANAEVKAQRSEDQKGPESELGDL